SSALDILQKRSGVTEEQMAGLEFKYVQVLDHTEHGIPNLQRQLAKSPSLLMQIIALAYKRSDNDEDPPEWGIKSLQDKDAVFSAAYKVLRRMKYIPGSDESGHIDTAELRAWLTEVRSLCLKHGRAEIGDEIIGQILAAAPIGDDGVWPSAPMRSVLEEIG